MQELKDNLAEKEELKRKLVNAEDKDLIDDEIEVDEIELKKTKDIIDEMERKRLEEDQDESLVKSYLTSIEQQCYHNIWQTLTTGLKMRRQRLNILKGMIGVLPPVHKTTYDLMTKEFNRGSLLPRQRVLYKLYYHKQEPVLTFKYWDDIRTFDYEEYMP